MLVKRRDRRSFLKLTALAGVGIGTPLYEFLEWRVSSVSAQNNPLTAAYSNNSLAHTWCAQGKDAVDYYAQLMNITIDWQDPARGDPVAQRAIFDTFAANLSRYNFVGVQPDSIGTLVEPITTMIQAGIPVVDIDTLIAPLSQQIEMGVLSFMSCDNIVLGEGVATVLANRIGGAGQVARIGGQQGHSGAQGRAKGFHNIFDPLVASGAVEIVEEQSANWDTDVAANLTQTFVARYPDLGAIFYDNDDMALAGLKVVTDLGLSTALGGIDAMQPAIQAVVDGTYAVTARNSANRVHAWSVVVGAWAATVGLEQAKSQIPDWLMVDGPVVTPAEPVDPALADTPWLMKGLGIGSATGQLWLEDNHLF
jgi:ribose transport system substrate-binding protein